LFNYKDNLNKKKTDETVDHVIEQMQALVVHQIFW